MWYNPYFPKGINSDYICVDGDWEHSKDNVVLMQYIGLTDFENNEIYEGDIVEHIDNPDCYLNLGLIVFDKGKFKIRDIEKEYNYAEISLIDGYKRIGNQFKNPELLNN